jgi:hypothetical protein
MLADQPLGTKDVIVQEDEHVTASRGDCRISCDGGPGICLLDNCQSTGGRHRTEHGSGAVGRAIYCNDNLIVLRREVLIEYRWKDPREKFAPVEGGDDY